MFHFDGFTKFEIDEIVSKGAFTDDQAHIFTLLLSHKWTDVGIMQKTNMSNTKYYRNKRLITEKIKRILREKQK